MLLRLIKDMTYKGLRVQTHYTLAPEGLTVQRIVCEHTDILEAFPPRLIEEIIDQIKKENRYEKAKRTVG